MKLRLAALCAVILLSACRHVGDVTSENGGGVYAVRSDCPIAGIPAGTGDVTLFNPAGSTDSRAIDVTAAITDLRANCQDAGSQVISTATFTVVALRREPGPARQVILPYFDVALRGGSQIAAKQVGQVVLNFAPRDLHAWARVRATIQVDRSRASLPANVRADPHAPTKGRTGRRGY